MCNLIHPLRGRRLTGVGGPRRISHRGATMQGTGSIIGGLSTFCALMAGISIAVERVVEMIKGAIPALANAWPKHDAIRGGILQLLAASAGGGICSQMRNQIQSALPAGLGASGLHLAQYVVIGLMAS